MALPLQGISVSRIIGAILDESKAASRTTQPCHVAPFLLIQNCAAFQSILFTQEPPYDIIILRPSPLDFGPNEVTPNQTRPYTLRKKSISKHLFWCFRLSQTEDSIQYLEGPNGIWKDHDRNLGVQMDYLSIYPSGPQGSYHGPPQPNGQSARLRIHWLLNVCGWLLNVCGF